jgi:lipopolysaccharide/colanic/teichoic acid biosynthesis glycosyltransferase
MNETDMRNSLHGSEYLLSPTKRGFDIAGSLALAGLLTPLTVAAAGVAAIDTRSMHPLFRQNRYGQNRKEFTVLKLRTLKPIDVLPGAMTYGAQDPRASRIGRLLRYYGIDELPQILNIIGGDMSLVGVRPYVGSEMERMESSDPKLFNDWHPETQRYKPAIFGVSQLLRRRYQVATTKEADIMSMQEDLKYMHETASLAEDVRIIATTPLVLLQGITAHNQIT